MDFLYERNLRRIGELLEDRQARVKSWMAACWAENKRFSISEAYRTQERQDQLWKIGRRGIPGEKVVTFARISNHSRRFALDIYPVDTQGKVIPSGPKQKFALYELEQLGRHYGIVRPPETLAFGDLVHYEILQFEPEPKPILTYPTDPNAIKRRLQRQIQQARSDIARERLQERLAKIDA